MTPLAPERGAGRLTQIADLLFALTSKVVGTGRGRDCAGEWSQVDVLASDLRALTGEVPRLSGEDVRVAYAFASKQTDLPADPEWDGRMADALNARLSGEVDGQARRLGAQSAIAEGSMSSRDEVKRSPLESTSAEVAASSLSSPSPAEIERMVEAVKDALDFLKHSGNQRAIVSRKFMKPSARFDWFERVISKLEAALSVAGPDKEST